MAFENTEKRRVYARDYYAKNADYVKLKVKKWRWAHLAQVKEAKKKYYLEHREVILAKESARRKNTDNRVYFQEYYKRNKPKRSLARQLEDTRLRATFFGIYGSECACCHEKDLRFLTIAHKKHDGNVDRRENGGVRGTIKKAIQNIDRDKYATLCYNCNLAASRNGGICPHLSSPITDHH